MKPTFILDRLAVGGYACTAEKKFNYILSLVFEPEIVKEIKRTTAGCFARDLFVLADGDKEGFKEAIEKYTETVVYHLRRGVVLINCEAGMSRSCAFVVNILVRMGFSLSAAEAYVRERVSEYCVSDVFIQVIREHYNLKGIEEKWSAFSNT